MIANLMMYRRPELDSAHDQYWRLIRDHLSNAGIDSPETLSQDAEEFFVWKHPELILSQTCGMPYRKWLHDIVDLVGTPDFGLDNCPRGYYRSALIVRADDPRSDITAFKNATFAYNQTFSQSGYAAPHAHTAPLGFFFEDQLQSGAHLASAQLVAETRADIAALDAVTWRNIQIFEDFASQLRVLDWTAPTPGLPLITAKGNDTAALFSAVQLAITDLREDDKIRLGIKDIVFIPKEDYLRVPDP